MNAQAVSPRAARRDSLGREIVPRIMDAMDRWFAHPGPGDWVLQAACVGHNPEMWHPQVTHAGRHGPWHRGQLERARAICAECPVRQQCLSYGVDHREVGVWGGLTEDERDELRRRHKRGQR